MRLPLLVCAAGVLLGFGAGRLSAPAAAPRWTAPAEKTSAVPRGGPSAGSSEAPTPTAAQGRSPPSADGTRAEAIAGVAPETRPPVVAAAGPRKEGACPDRLRALEERTLAEERRRSETEGRPIAPPASGVPERLSQASLTAAMTLALQQSKVPGRVETIDCVEYPCILYGRIQGDEDNLERIERARAFSPYRADLMTLLSWTLTDPAYARKAPGEERPERLLLAIALYTRQDRERLGDQLDRRIRLRTAELWNALRPDDEE